MPPIGFNTHLSIVEQTAKRYPSRPAFRVPRVLDGSIVQWDTITFSQFSSDLKLVAKYWAGVLRQQGIPQRSTVGLWISGLSYSDLLHIYAISKAGYVPQLFSIRLPCADVIYELLAKANAKALIYEPSFQGVVGDCPVPTHVALPCGEAMAALTGADGEEPLFVMPDVTLDDTVFYYHSSGSTSGMPKVVPYTYRWLGSAIEKSYQIMKPQNHDRQEVTTWMGSLCHVAQTFMLLGSLQHGTCTIQPTSLDFSMTEVADMIKRCGLTRLNQFVAFLSMRIKQCKEDQTALKPVSLLSGLDEVLICGAFPREDEEWAAKNGLKLRNLFGSTECGALLLSVPGQANVFEQISGTSYTFMPLRDSSSSTDAPSSPVHQSTGRLLELVVLPESPDCPDPKLRKEDGNFHTGDLFQDVGNGRYLYRGRDDDWIKTLNMLRCDTKSIEDNARSTCGPLIGEVVVAGSHRPSPVMFIEPSSSCTLSPEKLKTEIIRKTRAFHNRRYVHERITSTKMVVVVEPGSLPRTTTKGNVRRKAVEEKYEGLLDEIFNVC